MKDGFLRAWRIRIIALSALGLAVVASGAWAWEYHEQPEFCWEVCHVMEPYYRTYMEPGENHLMATHLETHVECLDCHTGPGVSGQTELVTTSLRHMKEYWITGNYDPDDLGQLPWTYPSRNCLQCHDDPLPEDAVDVEAAGAPDAPAYHEATFAEAAVGAETQDCYTCHSPHRKDTRGFVFPPGAETLTDCQDCHPMDAPVRDHALAGYDEAEGCRTCHDEHRSAPELECSDSGCHADWLQEREEGVAWTDRADHMAATTDLRAQGTTGDLAASGRAATTWLARGNHTSADTDCLSCHDFHGAVQATYLLEGDCTTTGCHAWIPKEEKPEVLLETTQTDHNGNGIDHRHVFETEGCDACHGPEHASVVPCTDCHLFAGANLLHQQHVATTLASTATGASVGACETCHVLPGVASEGCYACHRSGHDPTTAWSVPAREVFSGASPLSVRAPAP